MIATAHTCTERSTVRFVLSEPSSLAFLLVWWKRILIYAKARSLSPSATYRADNPRPLGLPQFYKIATDQLTEHRAWPLPRQQACLSVRGSSGQSKVHFCPRVIGRKLNQLVSGTLTPQAGRSTTALNTQ